MISFDAKGNVSATTAATTGTSAAPSASAAIGQQDFLTLMLAQLKNQDPLKPMENGEFLAQLAQFSTVGGIEKVNDTLASLGSGMRDFRIATAANLLGHEVLVPGNIARPGADGRREPSCGRRSSDRRESACWSSRFRRVRIRVSGGGDA